MIAPLARPLRLLGAPSAVSMSCFVKTHCACCGGLISALWSAVASSIPLHSLHPFMAARPADGIVLALRVVLTVYVFALSIRDPVPLIFLMIYYSAEAAVCKWFLAEQPQPTAGRVQQGQPAVAASPNAAAPVRAHRSPARARPAGGDSNNRHGYYIQIRGMRYCRGLIELAEANLARSARQQLSRADAEALWVVAQDGTGVTDTERATLAYLRDQFTMSDDARAFLFEVTTVEASSRNYYALVDGVQVDRTLWDRCRLRAKDGRCDLSDARKIWVRSQDGVGVTQCEVDTMRLALNKFEFTRSARAFLEEELDAVKTV